MSPSHNKLALLVVGLIMMIAAVQGNYFNQPNQNPCPMETISCYDSGNNYCSSQHVSVLKTYPPFPISSMHAQVQRLQVAAGTTYTVKEIRAFYTYTFTAALSINSFNSHQNGLYFSVMFWNASTTDPNSAIDWNTPFYPGTRTLFNRGLTGNMYLKGYPLVGTLDQPLVLQPGNYLFTLVGYTFGDVSPPSFGTTTSYLWFQTPYASGGLYADETLVVLQGASIPYLFSPLTGYTNQTTFFPTPAGRSCHWTAGAVTSIADKSVVDPTTQVTILNKVNYAIRYSLAVDLASFNISAFVQGMNTALGVKTTLGPQASVFVFTVQRQYEICYVDWYINTDGGAALMQAGLAFNAASVFDATGLELNNIPLQVNTISQVNV